ncbi:hypothetical protein HYY69_02250 [Candidatus Woesearchaeota archaeon]|nr:hypothetical protein [Candidatus Woesearchaeota archaeon]
MELQISIHAQEKMEIGGITEEQIKLAIKQGSVSRQTDGFLVSYTYFSVAYKKKADIYRIKTVFLNK